MSETALCQCRDCHKYLVMNRSIHTGELCSECCARLAKEQPDVYGPNARLPIGKGIPLAQLRGTLVDPKMIELLALMAEECAEVIQRINKIFRWGWDADFEGTTQRHKLELELGDVLAVLELLDFNGVVKYWDVVDKMQNKLDKFREDAVGPKQRLLHAGVP